ncbi:unnamed protein product [Arctia plantaginis]|uniref:NAD(P)H-hydrate epimerase n=1 Tax=Arctia plantaginis TaxID=874455 RepID=A0A8S1AFB6_ARCPL|nr:unnamed protein product [Arctia plantaginis]
MLISRIVGSVLLLRVASVCGESTMATSGKVCNTRRMRYLSQSEAADLDKDLFEEYKFSVDQLMELAGLSVASAVARVFPPTTHQSALVVCGPGNNGGDGLVAARHLTLFGYNVSVYYPKRTPKPLYDNLLHQCVQFGVDVITTLPKAPEIRNDYNLLVDALFGFSFKPPVRDELKPAMDILIDANLPVCSVDIPSGWNVETGPPNVRALKPALLISLSAPKKCAKPEYLENAKHFLGGRFLPPGIIEKYKLILPPYPAQDQILQLSC